MWFPFSFTTYKIGNDRLFVNRGLLNTVHDETLLYRIVDIRLSRNLLQRLFGTGTVVLYTKVDKDPEIILKNIKKSADVKYMISSMVEEARDKKRVIGKEFYSGRHAGMDGEMDADDDDIYDEVD